MGQIDYYSLTEEQRHCTCLSRLSSFHLLFISTSHMGAGSLDLEGAAAKHGCR